MTKSAATRAFDLPTSDSLHPQLFTLFAVYEPADLNKNCRFKLEISIVSISIT
jgi:hypothetical protein